MDEDNYHTTYNAMPNTMKANPKIMRTHPTGFGTTLLSSQYLRHCT
jgi:hypothetical protein